MNLTQVKTYVSGVLKGWFINKSTLDKLSENEDGNLLFNGEEIKSEDSLSIEQSDTNGNIIINGKQIEVYNDTEIKKELHSHLNKEILNNIRESNNGILLYKNKKITGKSSAANNLLQEDEDGLILTSEMIQNSIIEIMQNSEQATFVSKDGCYILSLDKQIFITEE